MRSSKENKGFLRISMPEHSGMYYYDEGQFCSSEWEYREKQE